ncbi:TetR/AcrR family transcriptional regulator [Nocardioides antri]|uniref:TetR/AcrR family transcriptional regulator n=2 Tax=Nocardioides antri TaxID=2607659 RepID=A0A5B1M7Q7_9ACTN|nr:TetR/AcrR family transcriptional regulator [Nocardioides antri]
MGTGTAGVTAAEATASVFELALADSAGDVDDDPTSSRILDAACALFARVGIQRCSMNDVAAEAGVSRITVYRRFASREALVQHAVRREFRRYIDQFVLDVAAAATAADRVVAGFVSALRNTRDNPLVGGLMATEPGSLVSSMMGDGGDTLATVRAFVAGQLRREQRAGHVADTVDVDLVAEVMVRLSTSFLVTPSRLVDLDDDEQLAEVARRVLVPLLEPAS